MAPVKPENGQGYQVDDSKSHSIRGEKYFRPVSDRDTTLVAIPPVCLSSSLGSVVYANGTDAF